jgi:stage II sporulation SpoE-like protein
LASEQQRARRAGQAIEELPESHVVVPLDEGRGRDRGGKKPGGFPGSMPGIAGLAAGALAFAAALVVGTMTAPKDPYESLDAGGVHAARLLAALDIDQWKLPSKKGEDEAAQQIRRVREGSIKDVEGGGSPGFLGAMIKVSDTGALVMYPEGLPIAPGSPPVVVKQVGSTNVYNTRFADRPGRWYEHPMHNRTGAAEGMAVVILATDSVKPFPVFGVAAAAGVLAFLGATLAASVLSGGTKSALQRLASDADAIAKGAYGTRVQLGGPAVVQHVGKSVQRLASVVASGASAPPQIVEVVRAPVQEITEGLAPLRSFQRPDEVEVEATQKIAAEGGTDYYDVVNVDAEHVGVFVADIPVRGVKSSMHMTAIRALFRANAKGQTSPAEVLKAVNRAFSIDLPRGVYVTAMYAIVERASGKCMFANAQHLPLVFYKMSKKASAKVTSEGIAIGLDPGPVFDKTIAEKTIQLERGDRIVLYTDGAINAKNTAGAQYGEERFYYVVNKEAPKNSAACVNFVANDVDLFHEGAPLGDDFTLVTLRKVR